MAIINLRKYYYPTYKKDTFIEVSDEVAEALLLMLRAENNYAQKRLYHKAYFSLDCEDGIENEEWHNGRQKLFFPKISYQTT